MHDVLLKVHKLCLYIKSNGVHTSNILKGSRQIGNAMRKAMGATRKRKLYFNDTQKMQPSDILVKGSLQGTYSGNPKRATVLNKLFMRHITDQMATGAYSSEILGHGIEINRVKVTADYKILRVYWIAKVTNDDDKVDKILQRCSGFLRHELSQLQVMGHVPVIQFVKDKDYAHIAELDKRFLKADFGPDHVPLDAAEKLKTEFEVLLPLENDVKEMIKKLESEECEEFEELPLPSMPQNVLRLNHAEILDRVKKSMKKSEALHRQSSMKNKEDNWANFKLSQSINKDPVQLGSDKSQRAAFKEFLHKRQLLRLKAKCADKYNESDLEYVREELKEGQSDYLNKFDIIENVQEDYIIEDWDEKNF